MYIYITYILYIYIYICICIYKENFMKISKSRKYIVRTKFY